MFVPYTKGGVLNKKIQKIMKKSGLGMDAVEMGGTMLKMRLQSSSIARRKTCEDECVTCETTRQEEREAEGDKEKNRVKKSRCRQESVCYRIECRLCEREGKKAVYIGETGRNAFCRLKEHMRLYEKRDKKSVLWKHVEEKHGLTRAEGDTEGKEVWKVKVTEVFNNDSLGRQVTEGVNQRREKKEELLNEREEWGANVVTRVGRLN